MKKLFGMYSLCFLLAACGGGLNPKDLNLSFGKASGGSGQNSGGGSFTGEAIGLSKNSSGVLVPGVW